MHQTALWRLLRSQAANVTSGGVLTLWQRVHAGWGSESAHTHTHCQPPPPLLFATPFPFAFLPPPFPKVPDNLSRLCSAMHGSNAALGNSRSTSLAELEGSRSGYQPSRNLSAPPGPKNAARSMSHHLHRVFSVTSVVTMSQYTAE